MLMHIVKCHGIVVGKRKESEFYVSGRERGGGNQTSDRKESTQMRAEEVVPSAG